MVFQGTVQEGKKGLDHVFFKHVDNKDLYNHHHHAVLVFSPICYIKGLFSIMYYKC